MKAKDVIEIRKKLNLTQECFAEEIGVSKNTIYNWENGGKIPDSRIKMLKSFIYTGNEKKEDFDYDEESLKKNASAEPIQEPTGYYYPDVSASAGLETDMQNDELKKIPINIPGWGTDISFINVYGDSMYPKYCSGEIIGIKEIDPLMLHFGLAYVVIMNDGEVYLKYITAGSDNDHFTLSSENPKNPPREYHLSLIRRIYIVKGVITKTTM